jgi:hypothetical protein
VTTVAWQSNKIQNIAMVGLCSGCINIFALLIKNDGCALMKWQK